jgi:nitric oxide reductase subunit B
MKSKQTNGSGLWKHGLLITLLFGFTVMLAGGFFMYKTRAPIPAKVVAPNGSVLFSAK